MNALERLEKLLDEKDEEIEDLQKKVSEYEDQSEWDWAWVKHFNIKTNDLPIPRLEIRCEDKGDWYNYEWLYGLVYKHLVGRNIFVPLGCTRCGGHGEPPIREGNPDLPFRDGAHIRHEMNHLNLRAFAFLEGKYYELGKDFD